MKRGGSERMKALDAKIRQMFKGVERAGVPQHLVDLTDRLEEEAVATKAAKAKAKA